MTGESLRISKLNAAISFRKAQNLRELVIEFCLFAAAFSSVATMLAIIYTLISESVYFFNKVSWIEFLTSLEWAPLFEPPRYGILPLACGTFMTTVVASLVSIPMGTILAIYLSEFAPAQLREIAKPILEMLAGIPTVIYGYFALLFVTPLLQNTILPDLPGFSILSAGLVMGVMIIPYVSSLSQDSMEAVPQQLREGSFAMGGTRLQTALKVVFPAAISGITAAYILGLSRAVGETMIVAIAAGLQPTLTLNPMEPAATISAFIVQVTLGDLPHGSLEFQTLFAAGLVLVLMTLLFNIVGYILNKRYREKY